MISATNNSGSKSGRRKKSKALRRIVLISIIFSIWLIVAAGSYPKGYDQMLTNLNFQFIINGILNFIAGILKPIILGIGAFITSVQSNPSNLVYASGAISAIGAIPLFDLSRKTTQSPGAAGLISIMYLLFSLLLGPNWFTLVYLSLFPTLLFFGLSAYSHNHKVISLLFLLGTTFVMPIAVIPVIIFSLGVFYRDWENGLESFTKHPFSIVLEGVSVFVFIDLLFRYSYEIFLKPGILKSVDASNLILYHAGYGLSFLSEMFANLMPLVPEFTRVSSLEFSIIVMAVVVVIFGLVRLVAKKIQNNPVES